MRRLQTGLEFIAKSVRPEAMKTIDPPHLSDTVPAVVGKGSNAPQPASRMAFPGCGCGCGVLFSRRPERAKAIEPVERGDVCLDSTRICANRLALQRVFQRAIDEFETEFKADLQELPVANLIQKQ